MLDVQITENSRFVFSKDIELILAAQNILLGEPVHNLSSRIYGPDKIADIKGKYPFLIEVFASLGQYHANGILEHLLGYPLADFNLGTLQQHLLNMERADFIKHFLSLEDVGIEEIEKALTNDKDLEKLHFRKPDMFTSYLGIQSFFRQTERYLEEYFAFAEELRTEDFAQMLAAAQPDVNKHLEQAKNDLEKTEPLEFSQQIMGKTFYNRGPYEEFTFVPSLMLPYRALRIFGKDQVLFFSIRARPLKDDEILNQLKVIADGTRFKIISLLGEKGALRGMDIAEALTIKPSTVSHHMEQLKGAGLLHEEPVKNSKYYSINKNNVAELLTRLTETLGK